MSSMPPDSSDLPPPRDRHDWLPSRRGLLLAALAFVVGLALFALAWRAQERSDFFTVEPVASPSAWRIRWWEWPPSRPSATPPEVFTDGAAA